MQDVVTQPTNEAQRAQQVRDLRSQIQELEAEDAQEMAFSPPPQLRTVRIYSRVDGEPLDVPRNSVHHVLQKTLPDKTYMFTANQSEAPQYALGEVKCFLHPESPERETGILEQVGLGGIICDAAHLASIYSKRIHAQHRHGKQWEAVQEYLAMQREEEYRTQQQKQLEATLAIAGKAAGDEASCDKCDYTGTTAQVRGHKMGAHKDA